MRHRTPCVLAATAAVLAGCVSQPSSPAVQHGEASRSLERPITTREATVFDCEPMSVRGYTASLVSIELQRDVRLSLAREEPSGWGLMLNFAVTDVEGTSVFTRDTTPVRITSVRDESGGLVALRQVPPPVRPWWPSLETDWNFGARFGRYGSSSEVRLGGGVGIAHVPAMFSSIEGTLKLYEALSPTMLECTAATSEWRDIGEKLRMRCVVTEPASNSGRGSRTLAVEFEHPDAPNTEWPTILELSVTTRKDAVDLRSIRGSRTLRESNQLIRYLVPISADQPPEEITLRVTWSPRIQPLEVPFRRTHVPGANDAHGARTR